MMPILAASGVSENVRVVGLQVNHDRSGPPSSKVAEYVNVSPSGSKNVWAGIVKLKQFPTGLTKSGMGADNVEASFKLAMLIVT